MSRKIFFLLCAFILSRIVFINANPVFYDSPEYISRFLNSNYLQAITSGHIPFHAGYILLFWPIFRLSQILNMNPSYSVIILQIIFSAISIYCLFRFVEIISDKKTAVITAIISSITPLYWIINVSIMTESTYINFFLISIFFLAKYYKKNAHRLYSIFGYIFYGLAMLTNLLVILWIPFLLSVIYFLKRKKIKSALLCIILTTAITILINGSLIAYGFHLPLPAGIHNYLFGEDIKVIPSVFSFLSIMRFVRNFFVPIFQNNTVLITILAAFSLIKVFNISKIIFFIALLWISPAIITNQWFDSLLLGRHGTIAVFGTVFLVAVLLKRKRISYILVIVITLFTSLPALNLIRQQTPYLEEKEYLNKLPEGLLIDTHFARPQIEGYYSGKIIFVNQPGWDKNGFSKTIDKYLDNKKPVFVTSQALSDPYGLYLGPFLHPLSLSYADKFGLEDVLTSYSLKKYIAIDRDANIIIYKILFKSKSKYPIIPRLSYNRRQINYFDPIIQLWFFIERANTTQSHIIIKG
jgi:hypothetical protein